MGYVERNIMRKLVISNEEAKHLELVNKISELERRCTILEMNLERNEANIFSFSDRKMFLMLVEEEVFRARDDLYKGALHLLEGRLKSSLAPKHRLKSKSKELSGKERGEGAVVCLR